MPRIRVRQIASAAIALTIFALLNLGGPGTQDKPPALFFDISTSPWLQRKQNNPVLEYARMPRGKAKKFPQIQHEFLPETEEQRHAREFRQREIKEAFVHTWQGYRSHAWLSDEVRPITGWVKPSYGNWSATIVDSLDTLWIMGLQKEFEEAVAAVAWIDFETTTFDTISVFETTIRYLGGLLSAYELSENQILLQKATQLGHLLYSAFDTPNRMPVTNFEWRATMFGDKKEASSVSPLADIASLSLEFTRLSQLTGDPRFYDAVQRINDKLYEQQYNTAIPGLWPIHVNAAEGDFTNGTEFSMGGMADSAYEYMPKMHMLLGGLDAKYAEMYTGFMGPAKEHLFYRPMVKEDKDLLLSGFVDAKNGTNKLVPSAQHLGCFIGGMVAVGSKIIGPPEDLEVGRKLTEACFWAYESTLSKIMPETFATVPCESKETCEWDEGKWHEAVKKQWGPATNATAEEIIREYRLPPGFTAIIDGRYHLRPEALESIFIMYRITGDTAWQDKAYKMWKAIDRAAATSIAYAELVDVSVKNAVQYDAMESFFTAETLKYLYLLYSEPNLISLDDWVFNTEAHPFRRPKSTGWW